MALQTGRNVVVAFKAQPALKTPATAGAGATAFRLTPGGGLRLSRAQIRSNEVRADGQTSRARLGSKRVEGPLSGELSALTHDALMAAVIRGNWSGTTLTPAVPPVKRYFTVEQYEQDVDVSEVFEDVVITSMRVVLSPDGIVTIEYGCMGLDMDLLSAGSAPYFTSPTRTTTLSLVATDAAITLAGSPALLLTGCDFTVDLGGSTQPVIGSLVSPDVFTGSMRISGTITTLRESAAQQQAYLDETPAALVIAASEPGAATAGYTFTLPEISFMDYTKNLGDEGAMIATIPFEASVPSGGSMISIASVL